MIRVRGLQKSYGSHRAVDGLDLQVEKGELLGLLGPNGAGKTTTISCVVGVLKIDQGEIELFDGGSPDDPDTRARLGVAPQSLALHTELTGLENLRFFGRLQGLAGKTLQTAAERALDQVGLLDRGKDLTGGYSGGMKRRLNLACALVHEPELIFLDEPTAGVDPQARNLLFDVVKRLKDAGTTVVYTTHLMEEVERLCDRVVIIDHGKTIAEGTVDGLIDQHGGLSMVEFEFEDGADLSGLPDPTTDGLVLVSTSDPGAELARIAGRGGVRSARVRRPDLQHVFLELTGRELRDS
ncbi:MAG: ABC transporter ATP-binding protein [Planctomycetota bacterium]